MTNSFPRAGRGRRQKLAELEKLFCLSRHENCKICSAQETSFRVADIPGRARSVPSCYVQAPCRKDAFATNKRDLEDGIEGVRSALGVLRDYYGGADTAHGTAGESGGIIGLREVIESSWLVPTAGGHEVKREFYGARRPREPDTERRL